MRNTSRGFVHCGHGKVLTFLMLGDVLKAHESRGWRVLKMNEGVMKEVGQPTDEYTFLSPRIALSHCASTSLSISPMLQRLSLA